MSTHKLVISQILICFRHSIIRDISRFNIKMAEKKATIATLKSSQSARFYAQVVENSIAQQKIEGLNPSQGIRQDLNNRASGRITSSEVVANIRERIKK